MELIRKLGARKNSTGTGWYSYGIFNCPFCKREVEKRLDHGKVGQSCGCAVSSLMRKKSTRHGHTLNRKATRLYSTWRAMRARCNNVKHEAYKNYGGRGIKVCKEWENSFVVFKEWALKNGHEDHLFIEMRRVIEEQASYDYMDDEDTKAMEVEIEVHLKGCINTTEFHMALSHCESILEFFPEAHMDFGILDYPPEAYGFWKYIWEPFIDHIKNNVLAKDLKSV